VGAGAAAVLMAVLLVERRGGAPAQNCRRACQQERRAALRSEAESLHPWPKELGPGVPWTWPRPARSDDKISRDSNVLVFRAPTLKIHLKRLLKI
jgi:hypothetical protein